jgi:putative spermidine/putrescine transport system permease protein
MTTNVTSPALYALGTLTTLFSASLILLSYGVYNLLSKPQRGGLGE